VSGTAEAARGPGGATSLTAQEALAAVLALIAGYVDAYTSVLAVNWTAVQIMMAKGEASRIKACLKDGVQV
jgi:hypothetical protein